MFKKLKDKIAEEVKSSPQRIQQIAQAAQAVVSSASSTTSEVSGSENFFSITEEETPHNSPLRKDFSSAGNKANVLPINNGVQSRSRRVSNSSLASDVSFRLPAYDNPAVYHLQSDMETSAGEESTVTTATSIQLESISKDQLYQAYRKILDRYQKYKGRYAELAQRYRDLERDNNKARAVLVETQEKALRRLCELREQCSLEQQAKAHLEAALRLEMDELQCVNKTLMSKLALLGENPDNLVSLDSPNLDEKIDTSDDNKINELTKKLFEADEKVKELQAREEENTILLAENKMMIHSELENKETEVKSLHIRLTSFENNMKHSSMEGEKLQDTISQLREKLNETEKKYSDIYFEKNELEGKFLDFKSSKTESANVKKNLEEQLKHTNEQYTSIQKLNEKLLLDNDFSLKKVEFLEQSIEEMVENAKELKIKLDTANEKIEYLQSEKNKLTESEGKINELMELHENTNKEVAELRKRIRLISEEKELSCLELKTKLESINLEFKNVSEQKNQLENENQKILAEFQNDKEEISNLTQKIFVLNEDLKNANIKNKHSESEAIRLLEESLNLTIVQLEEQLNAANKQMEKGIQNKVEVVNKLTEDKKNLQDKLLALQHEHDLIKHDVPALRGKIEGLKNDKRDLEKTLEKEIREKGELKIQVTNILQEIGRLEEQLKDVKNSHSLLQSHKSDLEIKIELIEKHNLDKFNKYEKAEAEKLQLTITEFEKEIEKMKNENSILSESNSTLEQNLLRLQDHESSHQQLANENIKKLNAKLAQCLNENTELLNSKELLEHEFRSLQDEYELKDKEKLCLLDTYKTLEIDIYNLKAEIILLNDKIKDLEQQKAAASNEILSFENKNKLLENEHNNLVLQLDSLQNEVKCIGEEKTELNIVIENLQKEQNLLKEKCLKINHEKTDQSDKLNSLITQKQTRLVELEELLEKSNEEKKALRESINKNATDLVKKNANYEELKIENQYLNTLVKQLEGEQSKSDEVIAQLSTDNDGLQQTQSGNLNKIQMLLIEIETGKENMSIKENEIIECKTELENHIRQAKDMEQDLEKLAIENEELKNKTDEYKNLEIVHQEKITQLKYEINNLIKNQKFSGGNDDEILKEENKSLNDANKLLHEKLDESIESDFEVLLEEKKNLESKLQKIMNEVQDVSIRNLFLEQKCENYLILEQSNERLKLVNDKLSRQLDETLVSIQHHEGISANTEFEYLKNIMFQYLSGNINKNNSTLVKVIAAVLKFTPQQTQIIIEKEIQRNSLLGQLNLL